MTVTNEEVCDKLMAAIRAVADHNETQVLTFVENLRPVIQTAAEALAVLARLATELEALSRERGAGHVRGFDNSATRGVRVAAPRMPDENRLPDIDIDGGRCGRRSWEGRRMGCRSEV